MYQAGRYDEALPFWKKALKLGQREFGPEHPSTAVLLNDLALLYRAQGKYAEAEPLFQAVPGYHGEGPGRGAISVVRMT